MGGAKSGTGRPVMRIAMLGHKRIPSREGGIEIVVEELAWRMAELGYDVTCYNRRGHHVAGRSFDTGITRGRYRGIRLKTVATLDVRGAAAFTSSVLAALCAAFGPYDIVHFHAEGPCAMMWLPRLTGKRCIATIHGLDWSRSKWKSGFGAMYIKLGERCAVRFADEIIVLSDNVRQYFLREYGRRTEMIPNGVSRPEKLPANEITALYGLLGNDYILFLGRIVPEKGVRLLLEAFGGVKTSKKLVIAGGASDTEEFVRELKQLAETDSRVIFTGFVQGSLLAELYSNAYLYTLPSELEGMPLSLLEAMSYGNCCLVSDISECTEVVEDHAAVCRKGSRESIRERLQYLCDHPEAVEAGRKGTADFICQKYSWDKTVDQTLALYEGTK